MQRNRPNSDIPQLNERLLNVSLLKSSAAQDSAAQDSASRTRSRAALSALLAVLTFVGCSQTPQGSAETPSTPVVAYCPLIATPAVFSPAVTLTGKAFYEYRVNGNGEVADGVHTLTATASTTGQAYAVTINGTAVTWTCDSAACSATYAVPFIVAAINALTSTHKVVATVGSAASTFSLAATVDAGVAVTAMTRLSDAAPAGDPNPIRYAEVIATSSDGTIVQCTETDANGAFSLSLPSDSATYTVSVASRSSNAHNTAYVLTSPTENAFYKVSSSAVAAGSPNVRIVAKATGTLEGGAFNILDQIYNAQNYLRTQTLNCNVGAATTYYPDCNPVTTIPLVNVYWAPGVSPGKYVGISGGISFYVNGERKLYMLGGLNGDTEVEDMDHFDNSVIIHEYGHFIEDQFGNPNSPGGSHNGNSIIDPRLAWGEGWANFFQAAVTGNPVYRDTYGHSGCTTAATATRPCSGVSFNEDLDPSGGSYSDKPTAAAVGEGNFREFSVTRLLWDVVKPSGTSKFSELWTALNGPTQGMKAISDPFKSIGRLHVIQQAIVGRSDWASLRTAEEHAGSLVDYSTPVSTATNCTPASVVMNVTKTSADSGSFKTSDQFRNNDFYAYTHAGGQLAIGLSWSGAAKADLDLYLYNSTYSYGSTASMILTDEGESNTTSGSATLSGSVPAGTYMINVKAYTGSDLYTSSGTYSTTYVLTINGKTACPAP